MFNYYERLELIVTSVIILFNIIGNTQLWDYAISPRVNCYIKIIVGMGMLCMIIIEMSRIWWLHLIGVWPYASTYLNFGLLIFGQYIISNVVKSQKI